jgi:peptidoglycan/LPS O-acetylase OafA/YrhL
MENHGHGSRWLLQQAGITVAVVLLAVAALDDITTDNATAFPLERIALVGCGVWFLLLASRLWRQRRRVLGMLSLTVLTGAALAQPMVGQGTAPTQLAYLAYLVTVAALAWFLVLAGILAGFAWRPTRQVA